MVEAVGREFLADMAIALRAHEATLRQLGFPLHACLALIEAWLNAQPSSVFAWEVPVDLVNRFPQHVRVFFRPQDLTPQPTPANPAAC